MSLLHLIKHKIFPSSDVWFYLNTNKHFSTNIFFLLYRQWEIDTLKESLGQLLFSLSGKCLFTKPRLSLSVGLSHKTQSYDIKIRNLPKQEYRPEQFHQSIKYYKKLFLAPFLYHVMVLPQSVFQNQFFKIPLKKKLQKQRLPLFCLIKSLPALGRNLPAFHLPVTLLQKFLHSSLDLRHLLHHQEFIQWTPKQKLPRQWHPNTTQLQQQPVSKT